MQISRIYSSDILKLYKYIFFMKVNSLNSKVAFYSDCFFFLIIIVSFSFLKWLSIDALLSFFLNGLTQQKKKKQTGQLYVASYDMLLPNKNS